MHNMESRVYEAALSGNVAAMDALLQEDELILDRVSLTSFHETPLHIAAMRGHFHVAASLLRRRPKLSGEFDALHRLPIHLAAIEGHVELVEHLLDVSRSSCSVRDQDGRTPLHVAAMKGKVDVIKVLIRCCPESIEEKLYRGETSLHLCVRYSQLEALILLLEALNQKNEAFANVQDDAGNTILHLAAFLKNFEIVRYLVSVPGIKAEINTLNGMGFTALDLLDHSPRDYKSLEIVNILMKAASNRVELGGPNIKTSLGTQTQQLITTVNEKKTEKIEVKPSWFTRLHQSFQKHMKHQGNWVEEMQGSLMLVATLTATISFQVAFSPPGGVWQQSLYKNSTEHTCSVGINGTCLAGTAVLAYVYPQRYFMLIVYATIAFFASISIVLLGISGLPLKNKVSTWAMTVAMVIAITFTTLAYLFSMVLVTPDHLLGQANKAYNSTFYSWLSFLGIVAFISTVRLLLWLGWVRPNFKTSLRIMLSSTTKHKDPIRI